MRFNLTLVEEMLNFSRFCSWREIFSPNLPGLSRPFYFSGLRSFSTPLLMRVHVPHALFDGSANFHDAHGAMEASRVGQWGRRVMPWCWCLGGGDFIFLLEEGSFVSSKAFVHFWPSSFIFMFVLVSSSCDGQRQSGRRAGHL